MDTPKNIDFTVHVPKKLFILRLNMVIALETTKEFF
jgi:hypothetical protein